MAYGLIFLSTGSYCSLPGLATVSGPCSPGFHCTWAASVPSPTDGITGDLCPPGHFCPQSSARPTPCPPGESYSMLAQHGEGHRDVKCATEGQLSHSSMGWDTDGGAAIVWQPNSLGGGNRYKK